MTPEENRLYQRDWMRKYRAVNREKIHALDRARYWKNHKRTLKRVREKYWANAPALSRSEQTVAEKEQFCSVC